MNKLLTCCRDKLRMSHHVTGAVPKNTATPKTYPNPNFAVKPFRKLGPIAGGIGVDARLMLAARLVGTRHMCQHVETFFSSGYRYRDCEFYLNSDDRSMRPLILYRTGYRYGFCLRVTWFLYSTIYFTESVVGMMKFDTLGEVARWCSITLWQRTHTANSGLDLVRTIIITAGTYGDAQFIMSRRWSLLVCDTRHDRI